jgi:hypothetical protein
MSGSGPARIKALANEVQIKVDPSGAIAKFDRVPVAVRDKLRQVLPDLAKQLGSLVNSKLDSELKTRTRLQVNQELHDVSNNQIYATVGVGWTGDALSKLVPVYLEHGTRPHEIAARNVNALSFFWERFGKNVMFKRVMHPGFAGIHYMERSFAEMQDQIVATLQDAAHEAAREVQ